MNQNRNKSFHKIALNNRQEGEAFWGGLVHIISLVLKKRLWAEAWCIV